MMKLAILITFAASVQAAEWYISASGSGSNSGTLASPWSLAHVCQNPMPASIQAGDTIWARGGTYAGPEQCWLTGSSDTARVTLRNYPGELPIISAATEQQIVFAPAGSYARYMGLRITNQFPRTLTTWPVDCYPNCRGGGVILMGPYNDFIGNVVDNTGDGISIFQAGYGSRAYDNVILYIGWESALRGHGHGLYTQNNYTGNGNVRSYVVGNIFAYGHNLGMNIYGSGGSFVDGIDVTDNVAFNNAMLAADSSGYSAFVGGNAGPKNLLIENNYGWYPASFVRSGGLNAGDFVAADNLTIRNNYFAATTSAAYDVAPTNLTNSGNRFYGAADAGVQATFAGDTFGARNADTTQRVHQRWNPFDPNRGWVVCVNNSAAATCDFTPTGLRSGESVEIRDALDPLGSSLGTVTYSGSPVAISASLQSTATPIAPVSTAPVNPGSAFRAFLLDKSRTATAKSMSWRGTTNDVIEYGYRSPSGIVWGGVPKPSISCNSGACTATVTTLGEAYFRINGSLPFRSN